MSSSPSTLLITGANTGLGLETVKALYQSDREYTILLGGRSIEKAKTAVEQVQKEFPSSRSSVVAVQIDIEDDESISRLIEHVTAEYGRVDTLINNAGAQFDALFASGKESLRDVWNKSWSVNTTSTQVFTYNVIPLLLKSSDPRLLFIASGTSTLTEHENPNLAVNKSPEKGWPKPALAVPAYRSAKAGMNMMMREWTRILKEDGVKVFGVSPGFLATGLGGNQELNKKMGAIDPSVGAQFVQEVVEGGRDEYSGKVIRRDGVQPW